MLRQPASPLLPPLVQLLSTSMRSWLLSTAPASAPFAGAARGLHTSGPSSAAPALQAYTERAARYAHVKRSNSSSGAGSSSTGSSSTGSQETQRPRQSPPAQQQQQQQQQQEPPSSSVEAATPRMAFASCDIISPSSIYQVYDAEELTFSWLSHWRRTEEKLRFETAVALQTRGRRLQRRRALNALVTTPQQIQQQPGEGSGGGSSGHTAVAIAAAEASASAGRATTPVLEGSEGPQRSSSAAAAAKAKATAGLGSFASTSASAAVPSCTVGGVPGRGVTELIGGGRSSSRMGDMEWLYGLPDEEEEEAGQQEKQPAWMSWVCSGSEGEEEEGALGPVRLRLGGGRRGVTIRPLWICVNQEEGAKGARLYESIFPLDEGLFSQLQTPLSPFCTTTGLRFGAGDVGSGPWRNFFVGVVGSVGAVADEALWPNQILHGDRLMWNVRDALDVARFLALPERADMEAHAAHLRRIAGERGRRKGWCWHMLRQRWGEAALQEHGIQV